MTVELITRVVKILIGFAIVWGALWFANNYGVTTEARLTSPSITIPLGATDEIFLRFSHRFDTEQGVDGGVVEVNVNGGGFNDVGVSNFSQNPYNRTLSGGTILGIRDAFSAQSAGYPNYISSIVDLGGLASASDDIQIQFI